MADNLAQRTMDKYQQASRPRGLPLSSNKPTPLATRKLVTGSASQRSPETPPENDEGPLSRSDNVTTAKVMARVSTMIPGQQYPVAKTINIDSEITTENFIKNALTKLKIPEPLHNKYELYKLPEVQAHGAPVQIRDKSQSLLEQLLRLVDLEKSVELLLSSEPPAQVAHVVESSSNLINIKEYPCKLAKSSGILYVSQICLNHYSKVLGFEKKINIMFNTVRSTNLNKLVVSVGCDRKDYKFQFTDLNLAAEAHRIISAIFNARSYDPMNLVLGSKEETSHIRAEVIHPFVATSWTELNLQRKQVILVVMKNRYEPLVNEDGTLWMGEFAGCTGWFPKECVEIISEPATNLNFVGYKNLSNLPTEEDWKVLLLGGSIKNFRGGSEILSSNDYRQNLYQVISGTCVLLNEQTNTEVQRIEENETFGEVPFLLGGVSGLRVVACGRVELYVLEAEYLKRLFTSQPDLGGRFFKYLACLLERRIRQHEARAF